MRHISTLLAVSTSLFAAFACGGNDHSLGKGPDGLDARAGAAGSGTPKGTGGTSTGSGGSTGRGGTTAPGGNAATGGSSNSDGSGGTASGEVCGGIAAIKCPLGFECIDNPADSCNPKRGGADCGGNCVVEGSAGGAGTAGAGAAGAGGAWSDRPCGVRGGIICEEGYKCVDRPSDGCDPKSVADCPGVCIQDSSGNGGTGSGGTSGSQMCGGIAAIKCQAGFVCVDNPNDSCDPDSGGADCSGICVPSR